MHGLQPAPVATLKALFVIFAFDPPAGISVFNESSNTVNLSAVISEDGKYIWANNNRVFKITRNSSQLAGSFTTGTGTFDGFRPDNSEEIMLRDGYKINFYNTSTFALIPVCQSARHQCILVWRL